MKEDPVEWLARQHQTGVILREDGWNLRSHDEAAAWEIRAAEWAHALRDGIAVRNSRDVPRVETLNKIPVEDLPLDHPWRDSSVPPWPHMTATGEGRPHNNPYSHHAGLVDRAEEILIDWRTAQPKPPKPASTKIPYDEFETWYAARASNAKTGDRSSREEDRRAAELHFQCRIPNDWPEIARLKLPSDHPYKTKGRRPG